MVNPNNLTKTNPQRLVEIRGHRLTTNSLVIADQFGRPHNNVLKCLDKLVSRVKFNPRNYTDSRGKQQRMYELDERSFLIAMPFIGGKKSIEGQVRLVDEFLRLKKVLNEPGRKTELAAKRDAAAGMNDMLKFIRETAGKETSTRHYVNEHLFRNRALTGRWEPLDETDLDVYDARLLAAIRRQNVLLMTRQSKQADRKKLLDDFVADYRAKHPKLSLIAGRASTAQTKKSMSARQSLFIGER